MIRRLLFAAIAAGLIAGVFTTAVQAVKVVPLILLAETYEAQTPAEAAPATGAATSSDAHDHSPKAHDHGENASAHHHDHSGWAPSDGIERTAFTLLANILAGVAFACLLGAAIMFSNQRVCMKTGMVWGAAGYFAFTLAPALGLPPELPGMAAAEVTARQGWWVLTAVASGAGIAAIAFAPKTWFKIAGVALLLLPHVIGAPQIETHGGSVPAELASEFAVASLATAALFWLVLGGSLGGILNRLESKA